MKQIGLILGLVVITAVLLTGGFSVLNPQKVKYAGEIVTNLSDAGAGAKNSLQIVNLTKGTPAAPVQPPVLPPVAPPPPQPSPSPSPIPNLCKGKKVAFDLLFDTSGSIGSLATDMQKASRRLISLLDDETVIGIQEFSRTPRQVVPYNKLKNNRAAAMSFAGGSTRDLTYMRDGFDFSRAVIQSGMNLFPGYQWYMVFFSDGVPNCGEEKLAGTVDPACLSDKGFADDGPNREQDPTDVANAIKPAVTVWSIGFYQYLTQTSNVNNDELLAFGDRNDSTRLKKYAQSLMQRVATPGFYREYTTSQSMESLYESVARYACP